MRCLACNASLTDDEATNKDDNGEYIDHCFECMGKTAQALSQEDDYDHLRVGCRDKSGP